MFLVPTGTAANALALAHVSPPWGAVFTHTEAHIVTDECGAPEFFGGGLKLIGLPGVGCKIAPDTLAAALAPYHGHAPHQVIPSAISFSQASEAGTIYRPDEIAALAEIAHARGMKVHMDGARLRQRAGAAQREPRRRRPGRPASTCSRSAPPRAARWPRRRWCSSIARSRRRWASGGSGPGICSPSTASSPRSSRLSCTNDCWLRLARHANAMADRLAAGLAKAGLQPAWPVEANLVFVHAAESGGGAAEGRRSALLRAQHRQPAGRRDGRAADEVLIRLVTSFATRESEVDRFVDLAAKA